MKLGMEIPRSAGVHGPIVQSTASLNTPTKQRNSHSRFLFSIFVRMHNTKAQKLNSRERTAQANLES
jgi:hypothetical protein